MAYFQLLSPNQPLNLSLKIIRWQHGKSSQEKADNTMIQINHLHVLNIIII